MKAIDRLFEYLENKGIPHTRFEKEVGLSNGYLKTQKRRNADLGEGIIMKIIDYCLDLDVNWLLTGEYKNQETISNIIKEPMSEYSNNDIYKLMLEKKESELKDCYEEIGRLKGKIERLSKDHPNPKYVLGEDQ